MDQASIIRDLLVWLESHLDQPLSLDNVAAKAGYSKWHLQRMFKDITGNAIGAYIRARRLSKAAVALRLTSRTILDIALQYRFDSQQTFTRAFKKQFSQTPALYRRVEDWNSVGLCPPIRLSAGLLPQAEFITLPELNLIGMTQVCPCTLEQMCRFCAELRNHFWTLYLGDTKVCPPVLYGLRHSRPSHDKDEEQEVLYTTALEPHHVPASVTGGENIIITGGEYVTFHYHGPHNEFQDFVLLVYGTCLPTLKLTRRRGQDIERIYPENCVESEHIFDCDYLIPIRR